MTDGGDLADIGVVVLAAGAATRFGGGKLLADLEGRPLLAHVLDAVRAVRPGHTVVVLGAGAERIRHAITWADEALVVNPDPEAGLAGSLRMGVAACLREFPAAQGVLVVLGDQPRTSPMVIRTLVEAIPDALGAGAWAVVPRTPQSPRLPESWGDTYLVCPACRERAQLLEGRPASQRCGRCNGLFEIQWDEVQLQSA